MPIGSFSFDPPQATLGQFALPVGVFLNNGGSLSHLPNVLCVGVQNTDSDNPPSARFQYILDNRTLVAPYPNQFEQLWPLVLAGDNTVGSYVVLPGDRLDVYVQMPDGSVDLLFDGYARLPQVDLSGDEHSASQMVTFSAVGAAIRCYDLPIQGRIQRNGDPASVQLTDGSADVATNLPTRFNPATGQQPTGQPNCTPENYDTGAADPSTSYPVFLDPGIDRPGFPDQSPRLWTLSGAVKYLLANYNGPVPVQDPDDPSNTTYQQFVQNPDFTQLSSILDNRQPLQGSDWYDPTDPSTYTANPIIIRDFDATNMAWPEAMSRMLAYHGFGMRWVLAQDANLMPVNTFEVYRKDAANPNTPKFVYLPRHGSGIAQVAGNCNVGAMTAAFDYHGVANSFVIETYPVRYEVSVVLAPLFTPATTDASPTNISQFLRAAIDDAAETVRRKYRWYGVDELGDGYYDLTGKTWKTDGPFDFSAIWPPTTDNATGQQTPAYVARVRPGIQTCITDDGNGDDLKAQLALSRDYTGAAPAIWDGSGHWQPIEGDWKPLDDRLGIEFTAENPEAIHAGKYTGANPQNAGSVLKGITSICNPGANKLGDTTFYLRLTTVIQADATIEAAAPHRPASPMANEIRRRIDAKDHFRKDIVHTSSAYFSQVDPSVPKDRDGNLLVRDDTQAAQDFAAQMRAAHEFPPVPMTIQIPGITLAYQIGDRVSRISGRDVDLTTNAGAEQGESPSYPFIVGLSWSFEGDHQMTVLQLSDRRMEPQPLEHRRGR